MDNQELAALFVSALERQIKRKSWMRDGLNGTQGEPFVILASITEEVGEVATDLTRERYYGAVAECVDVAHAAMRLAITLDSEGIILQRLFAE